jgi:hypothetical protein
MGLYSVTTRSISSCESNALTPFTHNTNGGGEIFRYPGIFCRRGIEGTPETGRKFHEKAEKSVFLLYIFDIRQKDYKNSKKTGKILGNMYNKRVGKR